MGRKQLNTQPNNIARNSVSLQVDDLLSIIRGCEGFDAVNAATGEVAFSILPEHFYKLPIVEREYNHSIYFTADCSFIVNASVKPAPEFMSQREVAEHYKIHQCRIATIEDCRWLTLSHKEGKVMMYRRSDVLNLMQNTTFVTWLNKQYERAS